MSIFLAKYVRYLFGPDTTTWHLAGAGDLNAVGYVNYVNGVGYVDANHASGPHDAIDTGSICDVGYTAAPAGIGDWDDSTYGNVCRPIIITTPGTPATLWFYNQTTGQVSQITHYYAQGQDIVASDEYESVEVVYTCFQEGTNLPESAENGSGGFPVFPGFPSGGGGSSGGGSGTSSGGGSGTSSGGGSGTSSGGGSAGSSGSEPVVEPINIPTGYTLWLKGGKLVVTAEGLPILCDSCPCEPKETCSAVFYISAWFAQFADTQTVDTEYYSAVSLADGYSIQQNAQVVLHLPQDINITGWTITSGYEVGPQVSGNVATFYQDTVTANQAGSTVIVDLIHKLRSYWFDPGKVFVVAVTVTYTHQHALENTCSGAIAVNTTTYGSMLQGIYDIETTDSLATGGFKVLTADGKTGWHGWTELWAVPGTGTPTSGTTARRTEDAGQTTELGSSRPAYYDGNIIPVAYYEIDGINPGMTHMETTNTLYCTYPGEVGTYTVMQLLNIAGVAWTDSNAPSIGATTYYGEDSAWLSGGIVSSTHVYSGDMQLLPNIGGCNLCDTTRGGIQTPPEEFE